MLVKPAPGLSVRDPATKRLVPEEGLDVPASDTTWARLIKDGDVVVADEPPASAPPASPPAPAASAAPAPKPAPKAEEPAA